MGESLGQAFFQSSSLPIAVVGWDGGLREVNAAWRTHWESDAGSSLIERILAADVPAWEHALARVRAGESASLQMRWTRRDARLCWVSCELSPIAGADAYFLALGDCTSESELFTLDNPLARAISRAIPFGLYFVEAGTERVLFANDALGRVWGIDDLPRKVRGGGFSHEDAIKLGQSLRGLTHGPDGSHLTAERQLRLADGRLASWSAVPVEDESGQKMGTLYVSEDITGRKHAERTLQEALERGARSEAEFRRLLGHVPDGIVVVRDTRFVYANTAAARVLGYDTPEQLIGVHFSAIVRPEDLSESAARIRKMGTDEVPPRAVRQMIRRDGSYVWAETVGFPTQFDGEPAVLVIAHDLTEEQLVQAQMRQTDRLASLGLLAAGVAHELNNPLAYVLLNLAMVRRWLREAENKTPSPIITNVLQLTEQSLEGAERMKDILGDLRAFSRVDDRQSVLLDVREVMESVIPMAELHIQKRAELKKDYDEVPLVRANAARLAQVFLNLLVNAAQALPEPRRAGAVIEVQVRAQAEGTLTVLVRDTGSGMTPEVLARVFDPFFTTKPADVGTGLGLSVCLGIVRGLGGHITAQSELGVGSTFTVTLPAADPTVETDLTVPLQRYLARARVLVVDDEPLIGRHVADALEGQDVVVVTHGREAVSRLREEHFDIVFCDLMMPEVTGMQVFEELVKSVPALAPRVVFMTAGAYTPSAREFLDRVPNARLDKPFEREQVRQIFDLLMSENTPPFPRRALGATEEEE